jgi:hypothetical protein
MLIPLSASRDFHKEMLIIRSFVAALRLAMLATPGGYIPALVWRACYRRYHGEVEVQLGQTRPRPCLLPSTYDSPRPRNTTVVWRSAAKGLEGLQNDAEPIRITLYSITM